MTGQYRLTAPRQTVWDAPNDPEILKQCIAGGQELDKTSDTEFSARVHTRVGPVSAKFSGVVTLSDPDPPKGYTISGEGKGGPAGFAKGGANVRLEADGDATILKYDVDATVGGKLAQLGSRLIDGTAKKMAGEFFSNFAEVVGGPAPEAEAVPATPAAAPAPAAAAGPQIDVGTWVGALIIVAAVVIALIAG